MFMTVMVMVTVSNKQASRPNPHDGLGGLGGGGLDGPHGRNAQVTIRLLVPLAAGKNLTIFDSFDRRIVYLSDSPIAFGAPAV